MFYIISLVGLYSLLVYFEFHRNAVVEPSNLEALDIPILATLPSVQKIIKDITYPKYLWKMLILNFQNRLEL